MIGLLLAGCGGPNEETLLDELRVIAVVAEPPEVAPGATTTLTATTVDPAGVGPDVLLWTCTDLGDGCLEAAAPGFGATLATPVDGAVVTERAAPVELGPLVADGTTVLPVFTWALACAPGVCPVVDLAASDPAPGTADGDTLAAWLADPIGGMADLPIEGTSLALTTLGVSTRAEPLVNPTVTPRFEALAATPEGSAQLPFTVEAGATAWGMTTAGGFDRASYDVVDGAVTLTWIAPEEPGDVDLYVVVNGAEGGSALWRGAATVDAAATGR